MSFDDLWLRTLQTLCGRAAHEIKGALNGVAVNLEVVRSRAQRPDAKASDVERYATSAADQLGALIAMTEGMLSLARVGSEPANVVQVTRQIVALLEPVARADRRGLELEVQVGAAETTTAPLSAVRLAVAGSLLAATERGERSTCSLRAGDRPAMHVAPLGLDSANLGAVFDAIVGAGITASADGHGISIYFP